MAYRRRQGITRASTFKEEIHYPPDDSFSSTSSNSLAAQAIRASAAHRETSLSSAYGDSAFYRDSDRLSSMGSSPFEDGSMKNDSKYGFWGVLARKAKTILEDDSVSQQFETGRTRPLETSTGGQFHQPYQSSDNFRKTDNPRLRKGLDAITSSLNQIGDTFEKAFEEGRTMVENKTADIIQETRKLQIRRKGEGQDISWQQSTQPQLQTHQETQLKASRDVAMATAAKAKLLLRELKTVKADLAFAKERCAQLEEENKVLREGRTKGVNAADDDLIRLQLETLLAEKARLAHENSIFARENRFLREIVEYHQLTMQDVVYLDEGIEEVTEVYPFNIPGVSRMLSVSPTSPRSPTSPSEISPSVSPKVTKEILPPSNEKTDNSRSQVPPNSNISPSVSSTVNKENADKSGSEVQPNSNRSTVNKEVLPTLTQSSSKENLDNSKEKMDDSKSKIVWPEEKMDKSGSKVPTSSSIPTSVTEDLGRCSIPSS